MSDTEATTIVDDIRRLWELAYSAPQIATALHLPDKTVAHVLQTGELPEPQPTQLNLFDGQPAPGHTSQK